MNSKLEHPLYHLILPNLEYQIIQRNLLGGEPINTMLIKSLNISILINLTCMLEGLIEDLLKKEIEFLHLSIQHIGDEESADATLYGPIGLRLQQRLLRDLNLGTWTKIKDIYELIIGEKIQDSIGHELWKSLMIQIMCRNMIAHGKSIVYETEISEELETTSRYKGKYETVYKYIREKGISSNLTPNHDVTLIFDSNVIDHFIENSFSLIDEITEKFNSTIKNFELTFFNSNIERIKEIYNSHNN